MRNALILKQGHEQDTPAPFFGVTFFIFFIFLISFRSIVQLSCAEQPVGVSVGNKVVFREEWDGLPAGTLGIVQFIRDDIVHVRLLNNDYRYHATVSPSIIQDFNPIPMEDAPTRASFGSSWPYWGLIKQHAWYIDQTCNGFFFCHETDSHHCAGAFHAFQSLSEQLKQPIYSTEFPYRNVTQIKFLQIDFLQYMGALFRQSASRIYFIFVLEHHAFLIEQNGNQFRLYQSWRNGFSLAYWTDNEISADELCEPGVELNSRLLDPEERARISALDMVDDTETIKMARSNYGCLQSLPMRDVLKLMSMLSVGFILIHKKFREGSESLIPAQRNPVALVSKMYLGKSALSIPHLVTQDHFNIEVSFMEF